MICIYGTASGIFILQNIIHSDLKLENILLDKFLHPKISVFGLSRMIDIDMEESMSRGVETFQYMASEIVNEEEYNSKVDVFSFGMIVHLILTGKMPFKGPFFHFIQTGKIEISDRIPHRNLNHLCSSFFYFIINDYLAFSSKRGNVTSTIFSTNMN